MTVNVKTKIATDNTETQTSDIGIGLYQHFQDEFELLSNCSDQSITVITVKLNVSA